MRVMITVLAAVLLFPHAGSAEPETGTICVAARAADPFRGRILTLLLSCSPRPFGSRSYGIVTTSAGLLAMNGEPVTRVSEPVVPSVVKPQMVLSKELGT
jgi:hypothetical protein